MSFEFYDTTSFVFHTTDAFEFYDTNDIGSSDIVVSEYLLLPIDWKTNPKLSKGWNTRIQEGIKKNEIRSAIATFSRVSFRYSYTAMDSKEISYLERKIHKNLHNIWGVPYWTDQTSLSAQALFGQSEIEVESTLNRHFKVGSLVALITSIDEYEIGEILSLTDTSITLKNDLVYTWEIGSDIFPILKGHITPTQNINRDGNAGTYNLEITEMVDPYIIQETPIVSLPTYLTHEIFNIKPNFEKVTSFTYNHDYLVLQFYGVSEYGTSQEETSVAKIHDYLFGTRQEIQEFLDIFDYFKGKWKKFWISTYMTDVVVTAPFISTDTFLTIESINWDEYSSDNNTFGKYLNFVFPDGTEIQKQIVSEPLSNQIEIDSALGKECTSPELSYLTVSFLFLGRFDMDKIELTYVTDSIATTSVKFKSLPEGVIV